MSARRDFRSVLRAVAYAIPRKHRAYFVAQARDQFRAAGAGADGEAAAQRHRLAADCASLLRASVDHRTLLLRYLITVDREGDQMSYVKSVAGRVGLSVPDRLPS